MAKEIYIINSKNIKEPFSFDKVLNSALRAGADADLAQKIAQKITGQIRQNMPTSQIFQLVKRYLKKDSLVSSFRFSLKEGMRKLGPTGFPFEKYMGRVFEKAGWQVKLNIFVQGRCLEHEVDFLAKKDGLTLVGECKFRNLAQDVVDAHNVFTTFARFLDIKEGGVLKGEIKPVLTTNAKFTASVIKYADCQRIELLGWGWPRGQGLEVLIDQHKLYPVTVLGSLSGFLAKKLIEQNMALVEDLARADIDALASQIKAPKEKLAILAKEAQMLLAEKIN